MNVSSPARASTFGLFKLIREPVRSLEVDAALAMFAGLSADCPFGLVQPP